MDPTPLEKVLSLRPTNVVSRFGPDSRVPVLNPRDLTAALASSGAGLACFPAFTPQAIGGILQAARDEDAPVGVSYPWPFAGRAGPAQFVDALRAAVDAVNHRKPIFLQAGPIRLEGREDDALIHSVVDAGFTSASLDASAFGKNASKVYRRAIQPLAERELSAEIAAPVDPDGAISPTELVTLLERLAADGALVQSVRVPSARVSSVEQPKEPWEIDQPTLKQLVQIAREHGAVVAVHDDGPATSALAPALLEAGVRRIEPVHAMAAIAGGASWRDEQADPRAALKLEALTWAAASDLIVAMHAHGTGSRAVTYLARGGRY